jgi:hypothetical protein
MIWKKFQLDSPISKATTTITLWKMERGIVEISENTVAIPIKFNDHQKGYVFHGQGKLLLDAIVETEEGAVGESIEKELNKPFLMLGENEEIGRQLTNASEEDFTLMGYESQRGFIDKAEDLCDRFFRGKMNSHESFDGDCGLVFAFENETSKLDVLLAKDSKLVYTTRDLVFVANENKAVLKSPDEVVVSNNGKSVIIKK